MLERLSSLRTLKQFLEDMREYGWDKGEGFIENKNGIELDYITGKSFLPTIAFTEEKTDRSQIVPCDIQKFHRRTNFKIFQSPHLLIRKILPAKALISEFFEENIVFKSDIFAIHAPMEQKSRLLQLSDFVSKNGSLLHFYILATSSRAKIIKATSLYDEDLLNIPYPESSILQLSEVEKYVINDTIEYFAKVDDKRLYGQPDSTQMIEYSSVFSLTLNSIYGSVSKHFKLYKILKTDNYYAIHFEYGEETITPIEEQISDLEQYIQEAIPQRDTNQHPIHIQKIMKVYGQDSIILVKPKQLRYWLPSIALRDADEVFADYVEARYQDA